MKKSIATKPSLTIGLDVGDRWIHVARVDGSGEHVGDDRLPCNRAKLHLYFEKLERCRIVLEVGTHSRWIDQTLRELAHEVIVADAGRVQTIRASRQKSDRNDARALAELGHLGPKFLHPIQHRPEQMQEHLSLLRARDVLVRARSSFVGQVRGALKACGQKPARCSTRAFSKRIAEDSLSSSHAGAAVLTETIKQLTAQIKTVDRRIAELAKLYPPVAVVRQIHGVGPVTSLAFVLCIFDHARFRDSRDVAAYFGLVPAKYQSGDRDPQLGITKTGNRFVRRLLVQCAQYILGPNRPDCDLRRYGERIAARGGKGAKKRAVIAVARKLAVVMHHLWKTGEVYQPLREASASVS